MAVRGRAVGSMSVLLAFLLVVTMPLGPLATIEIGGRSFSLSCAMLILPFALADWAVSRLGQRALPPPAPHVTKAAIAVLLLLLPPVVYSLEPIAGTLAYLNFFIGVAGGLVVGRAWASRRLDSTNPMDVAFYIFIAVTAVQMSLSFRDAESASHLHRMADLSWGASNYVAGCLSVLGVMLIVRARLMVKHRVYAYVAAVVAIVFSSLTLSRGGVVATAVGAAAILWFIPKKPVWKFLGRTVALAAPVVAYFGISHIEAQRAMIDRQVYVNIDLRFMLWQSAIDSLFENPIFGTGWAGFRVVTAGASETHTFAHNLFLSYGQIGGILFGLSAVVIILATGIGAVKRWPPILPPLLAALAISMTDPFSEGTMASLILWSAFGFAGIAGVRPGEQPPDRLFSTYTRRTFKASRSA